VAEPGKTTYQRRHRDARDGWISPRGDAVSAPRGQAHRRDHRHAVARCVEWIEVKE